MNAQIILRPNGDFVTRSNDVETVCRRVNPDDWDDDGIPNDEDANITVCDGDFFGATNLPRLVRWQRGGGAKVRANGYGVFAEAP